MPIPADGFPADFPAPVRPAYELRIYDGPVELLLDEVRRQEVEPKDLAMAPLVARFMGYLAEASASNIDLGIEWAHTAATLIAWKAASIERPAAVAPPPPAAGEPTPETLRDEILDLLLDHKSKAALELRDLLEAQNARFGPQYPEEEEFYSAWHLLQKARELARWCERERETRREWRRSLPVDLDETTVEEMIVYLRALAAASDGGELDGTRLLGEQPSLQRRACLFLAMLELARGELEIRQEEPFGAVQLFAGRRPIQ